MIFFLTHFQPDIGYCGTHPINFDCTAWQLIDLLIMPRFDHNISDFMHLKGPRGMCVRWFGRRLFYGFSMMNKNENYLLISLYIEITNKIFCIILHLILISLLILTLISILIWILVLIFQFYSWNPLRLWSKDLILPQVYVLSPQETIYSRGSSSHLFNHFT